MMLSNQELVKEYPNNISKNVTLSVVITTYNHERYIKMCLDSILTQKTSFFFNIIISEDDSTDNTRQICVSFARKYKNRIKLFLHNRKNNIKINGKPTGRYPFIWNIQETETKYIALCDGDDYWTDPYKLQKQVDFLEGNPDYSLCFHKVKILKKDGSLVSDFITEKVYNNLTEDPITINSLLVGNFIHTPSVVFRNCIEKFPIEFYNSPVGDYFLYYLLAEKGNIKRLEDIMAVYRYDVGVYSRLNDTEKQKISIKFLISIISYIKEKELKQKLIDKCFPLIAKHIHIINDELLIKEVSLVQLLKAIFSKLKNKVF